MTSGIRSRKAQRARMEEYRRELTALRDALHSAYALFNRTADPALLEASILEISALQVRYDRLLRRIKTANGDTDDVHPYHSADHRGGAHLPAAEAVPEADQMGV